ncbi:O-antigen ligase family protein [Mycolicibacterium holsaticum]|uniref:O-antigen ligase family protein n=1 Tax=Mycolicibacterium holsaticum TaxID=152142 RepID=UPI0010427295|nr:O-antigen ligase family protein [Mycolicibacterium holsaticum]
MTLSVNLVTPHRMRLIGVALLLVPQLYLPVVPTIAILWTLFTCIAGAMAHGRSRANSPLVLLMALFVIVSTVSLLWALPSGMSEGAGSLLRDVVFLLWLREVIVTAKDDPKLLDTIVVWTIPGVAVQSILTIVFRASPAVEERFLRSDLAELLVGPRADRLFSDMPNNVVFLFKSGGFYLNGNMASLFGGVAALLLFVAARRTARRWLYVFAALSLVGAIFTGSKTAVVVAACCAIAILFLPHVQKVWITLVGLAIVTLGLLTFSAMMALLERVAPDFYAASDFSYSGREPLWKGAAELFQESPFLGLGFGGWEEQIGRFTHQTDMPPHNSLIAAWAHSGIAAATIALVFMITVIVFGVRVAAAQPTICDRRTAVIALCAVSWAFIHGMADNTAVYGEQRSMILVALAIGYLYVMKREVQPPTAGTNSQRQLAGSAVAAASATRESTFVGLRF